MPWLSPAASHGAKSTNCKTLITGSTPVAASTRPSCTPPLSRTRLCPLDAPCRHSRRHALLSGGKDELADCGWLAFTGRLWRRDRGALDGPDRACYLRLCATPRPFPRAPSTATATANRAVGAVLARRGEGHEPNAIQTAPSDRLSRSESRPALASDRSFCDPFWGPFRAARGLN